MNKLQEIKRNLSLDIFYTHLLAAAGFKAIHWLDPFAWQIRYFCFIEERIPTWPPAIFRLKTWDFDNGLPGGVTSQLIVCDN